MKKLLAGVLAIGLLAGTANAQPYGRHNDRDNRGQDRREANRFEHGRFQYRGHDYGRIRGPAWAPPSGWSSQRYSIGAYLPRMFLGTTYYVDPYALGVNVRRAPNGARWVRVGDDLLLVSRRTGRVIEVVPDVFY